MVSVILGTLCILLLASYGPSLEGAAYIHLIKKIYSFVGKYRTFCNDLLSGALAFDLDYARWLDEHQRLINDLRSAINSHMCDNELRILVEGVMVHYDEIFRLKSIGAKADVFHMLSGMWKTPAERCFMWLGGFRSSEVLKVIFVWEFLKLRSIFHSSLNFLSAIFLIRFCVGNVDTWEPPRTFNRAAADGHMQFAAILPTG